MARIVVGIGGGIAAYKVATVVSRLVQQDHELQVVLTRGAMHFLGSSTFAALCGGAPVTDTYDPRFPLGAHIELAAGTDLLIVAPATARLLASCASGSGDDLLTTLYLNVDKPVLMAPAMSIVMWEHPAVQRNVERLKADGVQFVGPSSGWLTCRKVGAGRMAEPEQLLAEISSRLNST
jgi:phosphopantothenoylcysteine decarboxylase/phosphopantothenate--cysteine ligase